MPTKWSPEVEDRVIEAIRAHGGHYRAAREAGVHYLTVWARRVPTIAGEPNSQFDPDFRARYDHACAEQLESLIETARKRAEDGWIERPIISKDGAHCGDVTKYDGSLLQFLIKQRDPSFRDSMKVEATHAGVIEHQHTLDIEKMVRRLTRRGRAALKEVLDELRQIEVPVDGDSAGT